MFDEELVPPLVLVLFEADELPPLVVLLVLLLLLVDEPLLVFEELDDALLVVLAMRMGESGLTIMLTRLLSLIFINILREDSSMFLEEAVAMKTVINKANVRVALKEVCESCLISFSYFNIYVNKI
jgi:hypothetical protein